MKPLMAFYANRAQILQQLMSYTLVCLVMGLSCGAHLAIDADPTRRFNYSLPQILGAPGFRGVRSGRQECAAL